VLPRPSRAQNEDEDEVRRTRRRRRRRRGRRRRRPLRRETPPSTCFPLWARRASGSHAVIWAPAAAASAPPFLATGWKFLNSGGCSS